MPPNLGSNFQPFNLLKGLHLTKTSGLLLVGRTLSDSTAQNNMPFGLYLFDDLFHRYDPRLPHLVRDEALIGTSASDVSGAHRLCGFGTFH